MPFWCLFDSVFILSAYILSVLLGAREQSWGIMQNIQFISVFLLYRQLSFNFFFPYYGNLYEEGIRSFSSSGNLSADETILSRWVSVGLFKPLSSTDIAGVPSSRSICSCCVGSLLWEAWQQPCCSPWVQTRHGNYKHHLSSPFHASYLHSFILGSNVQFTD